MPRARPRYSGNDISARRGDPVAYWLICFLLYVGCRESYWTKVWHNWIRCVLHRGHIGWHSGIHHKGKYQLNWCSTLHDDGFPVVLYNISCIQYSLWNELQCRVYDNNSSCNWFDLVMLYGMVYPVKVVYVVLKVSGVGHELVISFPHHGKMLSALCPIHTTNSRHDSAI